MVNLRIKNLVTNQSSRDCAVMTTKLKVFTVSVREPLKLIVHVGGVDAMVTSKSKTTISKHM